MCQIRVKQIFFSALQRVHVLSKGTGEGVYTPRKTLNKKSSNNKTTIVKVHVTNIINLHANIMDFKCMYCHLYRTIRHSKFVGKLRSQIIEEINKMNWMEQKSEPSQRDAALGGSRVPMFCDDLSVLNSRTWTVWLSKMRRTGRPETSNQLPHKTM